MTTKATTTPEAEPLRFSASARGGRALSSPVPAAVLEAVPAAAKKHAAVVRRHQELVAERRRLEGEFARAKAADDESATQAIQAGKPTIPEPQAPAIEQALEEARRLEGLAEQALERSAAALLNASEAVLPELDARLGERIAGDVADVREALVELAARLDAVGELAAAQSWAAWITGGYGSRRDVPPYFPTTTELAAPAGDVRRAVEALDDALRVRNERRRQAAAQRAAEDAFAKREAAERQRAEKAERERRRAEAREEAER